MYHLSAAESLRSQTEHHYAEKIRNQLKRVLARIPVTYEVATGGNASLSLPRLTVESVGLIPLPLQLRETEAIVGQSEPVPFAQGSKTIIDPSVRNCRQIDANNVTVSSGWTDVVGTLAASMAEELGIQNRNVVAKPYKLVLYPPGGFFKTHRDTE